MDRDSLISQFGLKSEWVRTPSPNPLPMGEGKNMSPPSRSG